MQTDLTSGAHHGRTGRLYVWSLSRSKRNRRNGLDLRRSQPPVTSAQTRASLGGTVRGHDAPLAAGGQKHRWRTRLAMGCGLVCALSGLDVGEASHLARYGSVPGRKCGGARVHRASGRSSASDSGSLQHCSGLYSLGQRRRGGEQRVNPTCGQGLWLCRCQPPVVGYHGSGVTHWLSQRTKHLARAGAALWASLGEAQIPCGGGSRYSTRAGADDPQDGQRTSPVCQAPSGQAAGVDPAVDRGGPVDGPDTPAGGEARRASRPCDTQRDYHTAHHARGRQAPHPADRAVDHDRGGRQRQNRACRGDAGAGNRASQGGQGGGVWPAVSPESPRWGVYLWDLDPRGGGRVEDALTGARGVPCDLWGARHTHVACLRSGRICHSHAEGTGPRGGQGDWHSAQGPRGVARCRGRPRDGAQRAWQDRRDHWHPEDGHLWVQQTHGTSVADAGDDRPPVYPLVQSEQIDAGPCTRRQVRNKSIEADRTEQTVTVERQAGSPDVSRYLKIVLRHALDRSGIDSGNL